MVFGSISRIIDLNSDYPYDGEFSNQSIGGYYNGKYLNEIWGYESVGLASSKVEMDNWLTTNKQLGKQLGCR